MALTALEIQCSLSQVVALQLTGGFEISLAFVPSVSIYPSITLATAFVHTHSHNVSSSSDVEVAICKYFRYANN